MTRPPPSLWLELTASCNLDCAFCYNPWRSARRLEYPATQPLASLMSMLERLLKCTSFDYVALSGGEPLLYRELPFLVRWLADRGEQTVLTTNGRLLTDDRIRTLRHAGLDAVQVSLLGGTEVTHDRLARRSSHKRALRAVAASLAAGFATAVTYVTTEENLDELQQAVALVGLLGVRHVVVNELHPVGSAALNLQRLRFTAERFERAIVAAASTAATLDVELTVVRSKTASGDDESLGSGWHRWSVSPDGHLKLCNHSTQTIGSVSSLDDDELHGVVSALERGDYSSLRGAVDNCLCFDRAVAAQAAHARTWA